VHGANNVFKASLLGRHAQRRLVLRFGLPAVVAALLGAAVLGFVAHLAPLASYRLLGREAVVTPIKLLLGLLMLAFALFELLPRFRALTFPPRLLLLGGALSGFFGGLSGHQGALRSAFLAKTGVGTRAFVGTNAVIGLMVDAGRIAVYGLVLFRGVGPFDSGDLGLIGTGVAAALAGVLAGSRFLHKVTMGAVQLLTGTLLLAIGVALGAGLI
jgi:uncharacterized membrane protein YfcA